MLAQPARKTISEKSRPSQDIPKSKVAFSVITKNRIVQVNLQSRILNLFHL